MDIAGTHEERSIGKYGRMHHDYIKEHNPMMFDHLVLEGKTKWLGNKLLAASITGQKKLFSRYTDCVREYQIMSEYLLFQNRFKLGARMMVEVMEE